MYVADLFRQFWRFSCLHTPPIGALTPPVHAKNGQSKVSHAHLGSGRRFVGILILEFPFPHFRSGFGAPILGRDLKVQFGDVLCGECLHSRSFVL